VANESQRAQILLNQTGYPGGWSVDYAERRRDQKDPFEVREDVLLCRPDEPRAPRVIDGLKKLRVSTWANFETVRFD
jgi:hypothetical protein